VLGTVVALSPDTDMFSTICKIGVVAARPIKGGLDQNPPNIDIFWGDCEDAIIDPDQCKTSIATIYTLLIDLVVAYVMIEARTGYFEAYRHTLKALQCLRNEQFPLANHLAALDKSIGAPGYLEENQFLDLSSLAAEDCDDAAALALFNAKVLDEFPAIPTSEMDASQIEACKRILTKKLAIVQGPPGTGKTFTSKSALKVMVNNTEPGDPPILICARTNHALDQLLHHILGVTKDVLRLGSRYNRADNSIGDRTLHALRMANQKLTAGSSELRLCKKQLQQKIEEIKSLLEHLVASPEKGGLLTDYMLRKHEIITEKQQASLYNTKWARTTNAQENGQFSGLLECE
jgi:helicase required for RNAi-mediated heterochromatin assembly 1